MDVTTDERTLTIAWPSGGESRFQLEHYRAVLEQSVRR
jgi:hypothetical protein